MSHTTTFALVLAGCFATFAIAEERIVFSDHFANVGPVGIPDGWQAWKPKNIELHFESNDQITRSGGRSIRVSGNGRKHAKGSIKKVLTGLRTGVHYRIVVRYTTRDLHRGINSRVFPVLKWSTKRRWRPLEPVDIKNGWLTAEVIHQLPEDANGVLTIELFSAWIPNGSVYWDAVEVYEVLDYSPPPARKVNVAVIDSRPGTPGSLMDNCDFYVSSINQACKDENLDVICMTEEFNLLDVRDKSSSAVSMESEYMQRIKHAARENKVNLVGSVMEDDEGVTFNTGFLINREGQVVDKYRKAQLAMTEVLFTDTSQGDEIKVMQADFGKIGILICWDYQFPEFARTLALKGAEMLFVPIAGCGRLSEDGVKTSMAHVGKSVAMENRIPVVFSRWVVSDPKKPSRIIDARAKVVASSNEQRYIAATVELGEPIFHWGGSEFSREYFTSRRPELYGILSNDSLRIRTETGSLFVPSPDSSERLLTASKDDQ